MSAVKNLDPGVSTSAFTTYMSDFGKVTGPLPASVSLL